MSKLFDILAERYKDRQGGYTGVLALVIMVNSAPMAVIELVDRDPDAKGSEDRERHDAMVEAEENRLCLRKGGIKDFAIVMINWGGLLAAPFLFR